MRYKPYPYQGKALQKAIEIDGGFAFLFDPGLGKTKVSLDFCMSKYKRGLRKVLVGTTLSGIGVWEGEIRKHIDEVPFRIIRLDVDDKREVITDLLDNPKKLTFVIGTYPTITKYAPKLKKWLDHISTVIADELHYLGNYSKRQRAFRSLGKRVKWRLGLTGTLTTGIRKKPAKVFYMYKFLDESVFGTSKSEFMEEYARTGGFLNKKVLAIKNPKKLSKKIRSISYSATDADNPERAKQKRIHQIVPVYLSPKYKKLYNQMIDSYQIRIGSWEVVASGKGVLALKLQQMCGGFVISENGIPIPFGDFKLKVLDSLLSRYKEYEEKVVIFARFTEELEMIKRLLTKRKYPFFMIRGGVSGKTRDKYRDDFKKPGFSVICCQIGAGSESIDLTTSRVNIYYSMDFKPENFIQSSRRTDRNGQTRTVIFHYLLCENTIDYGILESISENVEVGDIILHRFDELVRGKPLKIRQVNLFKKGGRDVAKVTGSKKAQELVDSKGSGGKSSEIDKKLDGILKEIEEELKAQQNSKPQDSPKPDLRVVKGGKSEAAKPDKSPKDEKPKKEHSDDSVITVKELASELGMEPSKLRKYLRGKYGQTDGRWEWEPGSKQLKDIREGLKKGGK